MNKHYDYDDEFDDFDDEKEVERQEMIRNKRAMRHENYSYSRIEKAKSQKKFKPKRFNKYDQEY